NRKRPGSHGRDKAKNNRKNRGNNGRDHARDNRRDDRDRDHARRDRRGPNRTGGTTGSDRRRRHPGRGHDRRGGDTNVHNEHNDHYYGDTYYDDDDGYYDDGYDDGYYDDGYDDGYYDDGYADDGRRRTRRRRSGGGGGSTASGNVNRRSNARSSSPVADPYVTLGVGVNGLEATDIGTETTTGTDFNLGVGSKGPLFSGEVGIHGGSYEPATDRDMSLFGLSGDFRLQPRFGKFEPYGLIGVGGHGLSDADAEFNAIGASLRLGLGADVRFDNLGVSARYLHSRYAFDDSGNNRTGDEGGFNATSDQFGVNVQFYF
ncbi:MAG: hypothetical protein ACLFVJ_21620, partial [Persicimonas sp.]